MEFLGLPLHILLVHVTVVAVPLTALLVILSAVWPAARRRLGFITPLVAVLTAIVVPITVQAGEWLEARVRETALIEAHTSIGDLLTPWSIAVAVLAVAHYVWQRLQPRVTESMGAGARRAIWIVLAALMVFAAVSSIVLVVLIGHSGSQAVWQGSFSETPVGG